HIIAILNQVIAQNVSLPEEEFTRQAPSFAQSAYPAQAMQPQQRYFLAQAQIPIQPVTLTERDENLFKALIPQSGSTQTLQQFIEQSPNRFVAFIQKNPGYLSNVVRKRFLIPDEWHEYVRQRFLEILRGMQIS